MFTWRRNLDEFLWRVHTRLAAMDVPLLLAPVKKSSKFHFQQMEQMSEKFQFLWQISYADTCEVEKASWKQQFFFLCRFIPLSSERQFFTSITFLHFADFGKAYLPYSVSHCFTIAESRARWFPALSTWFQHRDKLKCKCEKQTTLILCIQCLCFVFFSTVKMSHNPYALE